ncbi:MAG: hypothetical protein H6670_17725 [Anaerolineaceae bacterium]|nr:hypothetical protein [Anaerolineaceae bacterium]
MRQTVRIRWLLAGMFATLVVIATGIAIWAVQPSQSPPLPTQAVLGIDPSSSTSDNTATTSRPVMLPGGIVYYGSLPINGLLPAGDDAVHGIALAGTISASTPIGPLTTATVEETEDTEDTEANDVSAQNSEANGEASENNSRPPISAEQATLDAEFEAGSQTQSAMFVTSPPQATADKPEQPPGTLPVQLTPTPTATAERTRVQINLTPQATNTPQPTRTPWPTSTPLPTIAASVTELYVDASYSGPQTGTAAQPFRTIQQAITSANNGVTIHIQAGVYTEALNLQSKRLTLTGVTGDPSQVVIAGLGLGNPIVQIGGETQSIAYVTLRGLRGLNTGVLIEGSGTQSFTSLMFENLEYGIVQRGTGSVRLSHSMLVYAHHAIRVESAAAQFESFNNLILHSARGIYAQGTARIFNNTIAETHRAVEFAGSSGTMRHTILWANKDDLALGGGSYSIQANIVESGEGGQPNTDPMFTRGSNGVYYLLPGSPAVNAGVDQAANLGFGTRTTSTTGSADTGMVDLGFHYDAVMRFIHQPRQIYVDGSNTGFQDGTISRPWRTIRSALDMTRLGRSGDVILVAAGTYTENLTISKRDIVLRSQGDPAATILDGNNSGAVITLQASETVIEGFTIQHGTSANGGAVNITTTDSLNIRRAILRGNIIANNTATSSGGAIFAENAQPLIDRNILRQNTATQGSAITLRNADGATVRNNLLLNNTGSYALNLLSSSDAILTAFNTFYGNSGGIRNQGGVNIVEANILWGNNNANWQDTGATATLTDNLVDALPASQIISAQSPFVNAAQGNFNLAPSSIAIDAALNVSDYPVDDFSGAPRPQDGDGDSSLAADIGAYESPSTMVVIIGDPNAIYVDGSASSGGDGSIGSPYNTISMALVNAVNGDTIRVLSGVYQEPVIIAKSVTLIAEGAGAIIQNQQTAVRVTVADVTVKGFTLQNNEVGLQANTVNNLVVVNNLFQQNGTALRIEQSTALVANNIIRENTGNVAGIYAAGNVTIAFNTLIDNVVSASCTTVCVGGIYAHNATVTVEGNILWNNGSEIVVGSGTPTVRANLIDDTTYAGQNNNLNLMPLFSDTGTLRPGGGSPVIDAVPLEIGVSYLAMIDRDRLGTLRPMDGNTDGRIALDMGALEALPQTSLLNVEPTPTANAPVSTPVVIPTQTATSSSSPTATSQPTLTLTPTFPPASATATSAATAVPTNAPSATPLPSATLVPTATPSPLPSPTAQP